MIRNNKSVNKKTYSNKKQRTNLKRTNRKKPKKTNRRKKTKSNTNRNNKKTHKKVYNKYVRKPKNNKIRTVHKKGGAILPIWDDVPHLYNHVVSSVGDIFNTGMYGEPPVPPFNLQESGAENNVMNGNEKLLSQMGVEHADHAASLAADANAEASLQSSIQASHNHNNGVLHTHDGGIEHSHHIHN